MAKLLSFLSKVLPVISIFGVLAFLYIIKKIIVLLLLKKLFLTPILPDGCCTITAFPPISKLLFSTFSSAGHSNTCTPLALVVASGFFTVLPLMFTTPLLFSHHNSARQPDTFTLLFRYSMCL